ncbi:hypothetical protein B4U80_00957 [Leptotrombidium deliense]|uniref:Uncharacterized protein n=1 Tax=Leptotrombidium deliense TaxID=299467 RepID=A0A443SU05_9ACAR|nr:hypothetical protein B4U80_00957 [Leptotrombidium deliense]
MDNVIHFIFHLIQIIIQLNRLHLNHVLFVNLKNFVSLQFV